MCNSYLKCYRALHFIHNMQKFGNFFLLFFFIYKESLGFGLSCMSCAFDGHAGLYMFESNNTKIHLRKDL